MNIEPAIIGIEITAELALYGFIGMLLLFGLFKLG